MHTKTIQIIQKAYIKTYQEDVKIYKDIENSPGQGAFFLQTPVCGRVGTPPGGQSCGTVALLWHGCGWADVRRSRLDPSTRGS